MTPQEILADLWASGITLRITADSANLAAPAGRLSAEQRALVLTHKAELLTFLQAAHATTAELIQAATRACDCHRDSEAARAQMRADCLALPLHLQDDLLEHFRQTYPKAKND